MEREKEKDRQYIEARNRRKEEKDEEKEGIQRKGGHEEREDVGET